MGVLGSSLDGSGYRVDDDGRFLHAPSQKEVEQKMAYCKQDVVLKTHVPLRLRLFLKLSLMLLSLFESIYRPAYTFSSNTAGDLEANSALPKKRQKWICQDTDFINILQNFPDEVKQRQVETVFFTANQGPKKANQGVQFLRWTNFKISLRSSWDMLKPSLGLRDWIFCWFGGLSADSPVS